MVGVTGTANRRVLRFAGWKEASAFCHHRAGRKVLQGWSIPVFSRAEPALIKVMGINASADYPERMKIGVFMPVPVNKLNAEFIGGLGGIHKILFINAKPVYQTDKRWNRGFANPDGAQLR